MNRDLFDDDPPPPKRQPTGLELGYAGAKRAADHAGVAWKELAFDAFCSYARAHTSFTTEDVRLANPQLPAPPDLRAWGQVALRAHRAKRVRSGGWTRPNDPAVHGGVVNLWISVPPEER